MKFTLSLVLLFALAGCQTAAMNDVNSSAYRIRAGSKLILHKVLDVPAGRRHVELQHGQPVSGVDGYKVNCELWLYDLGVEVVHPDAFIISRAADGQEWESSPYVMRYYKILHLKSDAQPDVIKLMCQKLDDPRAGRNVSVPEMREALGDYASFEFVQPPAANR